MQVFVITCYLMSFLCDRKFLSHKTLRCGSHCGGVEDVAKATRRRRRISRARFYVQIRKQNATCLSEYVEQAVHGLKFLA